MLADDDSGNQEEETYDLVLDDKQLEERTMMEELGLVKNFGKYKEVSKVEENIKENALDKSHFKALTELPGKYCAMPKNTFSFCQHFFL